ncbi:MAG TPA: hypothetical protein VL251_06745 [Thermomonas sp.]|nr:hypothetical protein [Thermomonas sp.]
MTPATPPPVPDALRQVQAAAADLAAGMAGRDGAQYRDDPAVRAAIDPPLERLAQALAALGRDAPALLAELDHAPRLIAAGRHLARAGGAGAPAGELAQAWTLAHACVPHLLRQVDRLLG